MAEPISPLARTATDALHRLREEPPARALENSLVQRPGSQLLSGPFAGTAYATRAARKARTGWLWTGRR
jgi:hypothetical protein